ncbi:muscleblind-like protein 2a [Lethenteron reissneri]|uniref:muscleblind-like protein 2a n=1 Tax=Lethenteron reissneri TaxID=7753 RepID=UPI002AB6D2F2|nr:muscleblind-like protein 2a [Lethenteron reissneri]XP_061416510.1 muscleblind-like protein 2a [Lethenteron reissneri]XP_061416511.1 muscleblind-like protein 2a [Lethenteron reissneri]
MYNDENNMDSVSLASRDTNWLLLEVCREFQRSSCSRTAEECRYAHPPQHVNISNGRVIACFDFLKGRCSRENCKYLHAPPHLATPAGAGGPHHSAVGGTKRAQLPIGGSGAGLFEEGSINSDVALAVAASNQAGSRDNNWLMLEVCRDFQRGTCSRTEDECRYAHPPKHVTAPHGRVIACFDFVKGRCTRENCKYFHPPKHFKMQLEISGKNHGIQQKNVTAISQMQMTAPSMLAPVHTYPQLSAQPQAASSLPYGNYLASSLTPAVTYPSPEILAKAAGVPTAYATLVMNAMQAAASLQLGTQTPLRPDKLEVCTEFLRGSCPLLNTSCRLAHPPDLKLIDPVDGRVTVCMDFVMARCMRPKCRYFHPPLHLQAMVKALHHQANQAAAAAANAATPTAAKSLKRPHDAAQNAEEEEEVVEEEQVEERKKRFGVVNESSAVAADDTET